jgi:hypothetical protein
VPSEGAADTAAEPDCSSDSATGSDSSAAAAAMSPLFVELLPLFICYRFKGAAP